ncbi:hypothetical protein OIU76_027388 [Salix suchowensis]|nr:hypothetical protein OIU76_027388 [Salix suchowensis]
MTWLLILPVLGNHELIAFPNSYTCQAIANILSVGKEVCSDKHSERKTGDKGIICAATMEIIPERIETDG